MEANTSLQVMLATISEQIQPIQIVDQFGDTLKRKLNLHHSSQTTRKTHKMSSKSKKYLPRKAKRILIPVLTVLPLILIPMLIVA